MNASGESYSVGRLIALFFAWKSLLLVVAWTSPGSGYDTSTQLLFDQYGPGSQLGTLEHVVLRLTRWDGIYFATLAERGHVNEQDWAFSWVLARFTDWTARVLFSPLSTSSIVQRALSGIIISHVSHFLAVITLYQLTTQLLQSYAPMKSRIAFTAASLHIVSPAGLFLSAPYGESTFAFLNFAGTLSYILAIQHRYGARPTSFCAETFYTLLSGLFFAGAATIRGNGLLSGIPFAWDALEAILQPTKLTQSFRELRRLLATGIAGMLVGIGFALPQAVAYQEYCTGGQRRLWCDRTPPSIYSWVQDHYWGVGFLRYWTLSNLPLFLIAAPVLGLLLLTGFTCVRRPNSIVRGPKRTGISKRIQQSERAGAREEAFAKILQRLALPQLALATMAATNFHVQIINRISSGYPLWYIVLAAAIHSPRSVNEQKSGAPSVNPKRRNDNAKALGVSRQEDPVSQQGLDLVAGVPSQLLVRGMVMYAIIQGGLYASFLPPA